MAAVDEISRLKIWNLYVIPKLEIIIQKMRISNRRYAYMDYFFFTDKVSKIKILGKKNALRKRFMSRCPCQSKNETGICSYESRCGLKMYYNCMKDVVIDDNTFVIVMFLYSQFYIFSPTLYKINSGNKDCYRPFSLTYNYQYTTNIWFREEILRQKFNNIKPELIWYKLKQLGEDETLVIQNNAADNDIYFEKMYMEEFVEHLKLVLVHQDIIKKIIRLIESDKKFLIYYINHYMTYFFLFLTYDMDKKKFE